MTIMKNAGRQFLSAAVQEINLADFADGAVQAAIELPPGATITSGLLVTDVAFDAATTATISVGTEASATAYLSATSVAATGMTALVPTGAETTGIEDVYVTYASTGTAATEGTARLIVEYVVEGRSQFTQG